jgi:hypothetical protein
LAVCHCPKAQSVSGDGVADGNGVVTDENLLDEKSNDTLALQCPSVCTEERMRVMNAVSVSVNRR